MYGQKPEDLVKDLEEEKEAAISFLLRQTRIQGSRLFNTRVLSKAELDTILHDAVLMAIQKIKNKQFNEEQGHIVGFTVGIMKYMGLNASRSLNKTKVTMNDELLNRYSETAQEYGIQMERITLLNTLLEQMNSPCKELIYYRYLEPCPDQEILDKKITNHANINSLRATRSECLKKLTTLASKYKHLYYEF